MPGKACVRVGIGGWNYAPWRGTFYPPGTAQARELVHASRQVTAIEINGTFYRLQTAETFARWHDATPKGFMFSVKAPRCSGFCRAASPGSRPSSGRSCGSCPPGSAGGRCGMRSKSGTRAM